MSDTPEENTLTHLGLQVSTNLKERLQKMADNNHRKLSDECRLALENHAAPAPSDA